MSLFKATKWWIADLSGPEYSKMIREDARKHVAIHLLLLLLSGLIQDDGFFFGWISFSALTYWSMVIPILIRKREPTRFDAGVARYGVISALVVISPLCLLVLSLFRQ